MASNANRKRSQETPSVLEQTKKRFQDSWDYQKTNWHDKWQRDNKLYNNERYKAQYHGVTDTFVPLTFSTVETMVSALNNANLRFDYESWDPMAQVSTAPLNALIDEWWDADQWDLAFEEGEREMFVTGMAGFMLSWEIDKPHLHYGAMIDYIVDPTISHPAQLQESGSYAGRRYLVRKGSLEEFEVVDTDEKSKTYGQVVKRFKMPTEAERSNAPSGEDTDKMLKEISAGSTLQDAANDQDEVIEIWDVDRVVTMLNRQFIIEDVENPYKARHRQLLWLQYVEEGYPEEDATVKADADAQGLVPFFFFRNYRRSSLFYAKSEIDAIAKPQEYLNDMRNMSSDAIIKSLSRQRWLDPRREDWLDLIDEEPETVYPFAKDDMGFYDAPRVDSNAFNAETVTKQEMREVTALDQIMKGQGPVGDPTATQINAQVTQSSERIESKARVLQKDGLYWMAHILFRMFQLYVTEPMVVRVKGSDVSDVKTTVTLPTGEERQLPPGTALLDPADYRGSDWQPKVTLEVDANSKKAEEQTAAKENYSIIVQDPTNNLAAAKTVMYPKMFDLSQDDLEAITTPDPQQEQMLAGQMGMGGPVEGADPVAGAIAPEDALSDSTAGVPQEQPLPDDVDADALRQVLTPEEWEQLREALMQGAAA